MPAAILLTLWRDQFIPEALVVPLTVVVRHKLVDGVTTLMRDEDPRKASLRHTDGRDGIDESVEFGGNFDGAGRCVRPPKSRNRAMRRIYSSTRPMSSRRGNA